MAQFLELSLEEYNADNEQLNFNAVCVCCLTQNVPLIHLATCKHNGFLHFYFKLKMEVQNSLVCYYCHGLLKKIDGFMQQIQESYVVLNEKALQYKKEKLHSLQCTQVEVLSVYPTVSDDELVKTEPTTSKEYQDFSIKKEISVLEDIKPLSGKKNEEFDVLTKEEIKCKPVKKEKKAKKDVIATYVGKLLVTVLSAEEMQKEREKQRTEDKYQKRPFKCEKCIVAFDHEINLMNHMEMKHKPSCGGHVCEICQCVYDSDVSLKAHHKRHFTRFKCKTCDKQYLDERSAVLHYREKHTKGPQLYQCKVEDCGFETRSHRSFRYHQGRHNQVQCTYCSKLYMKGTQLRIHINTVHKQSSVFKCDKCDKQYKQRSGLSVHMQSAHGAAPAAAYCHQCRRHFRTPQILARHLRFHSNHVDKKYMCDECGARFVSKGNLKYHIEWAHLKMATYKCIQCSKVLRTSRALRRHVDFVHENKQLPRDKICHYCGKGFTSSAYLRTHLLSHTGERPHRCACCGASFAHRAALYTHHKRHLTPRA